MALTCLIAISSARAQEANGTSPVEHADDSGPSVAAARVVVRSAAEWLARGVDSWFGNKPFSEGGKVSDGEIGLNLYKRQDQGLDASVRFNARFRLPNLEEKTYLFTGHDNWKGLVTDKPAAFTTKQQLLHPDNSADQAFFAGIGRFAGESTDMRIGFKSGLTPFAQVRYRRRWLPTADDQLEFSETFFLTSADHLGSTTTTSYQHQFSPTLVARWLNAVTVTQVDPNAEWNGSLGAYRLMGQQRLLSLEILASSKQNTGLAFTDYGVQVRWEQPVDHNRLMGEIIVGHFWPQSVDASARSRAWAFGAGLKMSF